MYVIFIVLLFQGKDTLIDTNWNFTERLVCFLSRQAQYVAQC